MSHKPMITVMIQRERYNIYRGGYFDGSVEGRREVVFSTDEFEILELARPIIHEFVEQEIEKDADCADFTVFIGGIPQDSLDSLGMEAEYRFAADIEQHLLGMTADYEREYKTGKARKANEERLARERKIREEEGARDRADYERLRAKFGG